MTRYRSFTPSTGAVVIVPEENEKSEPFSNRNRFGFLLFGGRYRTRTCDLLHVKQMLYQLS